MRLVNLNDFNDVFTINADQNVGHRDYERTRDHRRTLDHELFFDRLLKVLHVNGATHPAIVLFYANDPSASHLYPPRTNQDLRELHQRIVAAPIARHHKLSLLFYILKDFDDDDARDDQLSMEFSEDFFLPERYRIYVSGLWELDHLNFRRALDFLTEPSLIPTFPDEILETLLKHTRSHEQDLALAYYHTVSPPLANEKIRDLFFEHLAKISITETYTFAREQGDPIHRVLFEMLISVALTNETGEARATRCVELVNLPFDEEEEEWFEEHLTNGKGRSLHGARDTIMVRRIAMGKMTDALKEGEHLSGRRMNGVNWDMVKSGLKAGVSVRTESYQPG